MGFRLQPKLDVGRRKLVEVCISLNTRWNVILEENNSHCCGLSGVSSGEGTSTLPEGPFLLIFSTIVPGRDGRCYKTSRNFCFQNLESIFIFKWFGGVFIQPSQSNCWMAKNCIGEPRRAAEVAKYHLYFSYNISNTGIVNRRLDQFKFLIQSKWRKGGHIYIYLLLERWYDSIK